MLKALLVFNVRILYWILSQNSESMCKMRTGYLQIEIHLISNEIHSFVKL